MLLQTSVDDYLGSGHDKDILSPHGTQGLECLSLQTALYLGDRLNTWRRLVGFSLLCTIRCQRAGSHRRPSMLQYLLRLHLGTGQQSKFQSTRKTRGPTPSKKRNDQLKYPSWNMPNVSSGVPENPLGILLTVHIGVSRGPQTLCPLFL